MNKELLLTELQLKPHVEGGYFIRSYTSSRNVTGETGSPNERPVMTCIYYMLTIDQPINHYHKNGSDIVHFYHMGLPIRYHVITPEGHCSSTVLGPNISAGQKPQLMVAAGCWKAAELMLEKDNPLDYGLISEAVGPGFDYADWSVATKEDIQKIIPQNWEQYKHLITS